MERSISSFHGFFGTAVILATERGIRCLGYYCAAGRLPSFWQTTDWGSCVLKVGARSIDLKNTHTCVHTQIRPTHTSSPCDETIYESRGFQGVLTRVHTLGDLFHISRGFLLLLQCTFCSRTKEEKRNAVIIFGNSLLLCMNRGESSHAI